MTTDTRPVDPRDTRTKVPSPAGEGTPFCSLESDQLGSGRSKRNLGTVIESASSKNTSTGSPIATSWRSSSGRSLTMRIPSSSSIVATT